MWVLYFAGVWQARYICDKQAEFQILWKCLDPKVFSHYFVVEDNAYKLRGTKCPTCHYGVTTVCKAIIWFVHTDYFN